MNICPDCKKPVDPHAVFCDNCGLRLKSDKTSTPPEAEPGICSACGYKNIPGETFCQNCGVQLAPVRSSPPPPAKPYTPSGQQSAREPVDPRDAATIHDTSPITCHECGYVNEAGQAYCQNCGLRLAPKSDQTPSKNIYLQSSGKQKLSIDPVSATPSHPISAEGPCPSCGHVNVPGEHFCQNCGLPLLKPEDAEEAQLYETVPLKSGDRPIDKPSLQPEQNKLHGKLVHPESDLIISLPIEKEEFIIGRTDPFQGIFPDIDLTPYGGDSGGVSREHARLFIHAGGLLLEDLNSTNYTFINKIRLPPGETHQVKHEDEIRLGGVVLIYLSDKT